jgi:CRISPR-associated protein Csd1
MLKALVESVARFEELPPSGYGPVKIQWVIDLSRGPAQAVLTGFEKGAVTLSAPVRRDRTSGVKASLLVDKASYALGLSEQKTIDTSSREHAAFKDILRSAVAETHEFGIAVALEFLDHHWGRNQGPLEERVIAKVDPRDIVAFRSDPSSYPFDCPSLKSFWRGYLRTGYSAERTCCCVCGRQSPVLRTLPWKVEIFKIYKCALSSFNKSAFTSFGKEQTANSPLCFDCGATASSVLQYLVGSERHTRVLARDESRGAGKAPLRNQLAVFWLQESPGIGGGGELDFDLEAALAEPITAEHDGPPPDPSHVDALYGLPWRESASGLQIARNRFYVAVLSPNKSRLVLREWIATSLDAVCRVLKQYDAARTIVSVDGHSVDRVAVQDMLWALRPWKSRSASDSANIVRGLVRTAYTGTPPPPELLDIAVQRFRVPVRPRNNEIAELEKWRQAQAAAIKLVLTYGTEEASTLQSLNVVGRSGPHLCGQLLAVLEEAQLRASGWRINATLVDRFYGGASTSPSTTLGSLVKQATQAHMPKIRKSSLGYEELEQTIENVMQELDECGGLPGTLTLRQQGEFALGFYLRRAAFRANRPKREPARNEGMNTETEKSK